MNDAAIQAEQASCAAALACSRDEIHAQGLRGTDFVLQDCGQVWDLALGMDTPSPILLGSLRPDLVVEWWRWDARWWMYAHPAGLRAHAAVVKAESNRRAAIQGHVDTINEIREQGTHWREAYKT